MALANLSPFCSSLTRSLSGVEEAKNFSQLVLIWAAAPVDEPVPAPPELADAPPAALVGVDAGALVFTGICVPVVLELLELEQAAAASTVTMTPATARPLAGWNRIAVPPEVLERICICLFPRIQAIVFPSGRFLLSDDPRSPTLTSGAGFSRYHCCT
jgi:hypothetical protein